MMQIQIQSQNEIVKIRPLQLADFDSLFKAAGNPEIWLQHPAKNRYQLEGFRPYFNEAMASKGAHLVIDYKTNEVIGSARYKILDTQNKIVEIGWTFLSKEYWGGKYNRALKTLMVNHIIHQGGLIVLYVGASNIRSQKAVEKIGGKRVTDKEFKYSKPDPKLHMTYIITESL